MWWFYNSRNRRLKRPAVLETKGRSRQKREAWWHLALTALSVAVGTLIGLFALWRGGVWLLDRFVFENQAFAIQVVQVETDGVIPNEQLRAWAGVKEGNNLLALDLGQIKRNLELVSMIKAVAVERVLPHKLMLRVIEREPLAQAYALQRRPNDVGYQVISYYLDAEGCVLAPTDMGRHGPNPLTTNDDLPVLSGFSSAYLQPGRQIDSPQVLAALRLIKTLEHSPMAGIVVLTRIDVTVPEVLQVTTQAGAQVTLAADHLDTQLRRWRAVHDHGLKAGLTIDSLDLSVTNNLPVHWVESSLVPPAPPVPQKISRYRKKHV